MSQKHCTMTIHGILVKTTQKNKERLLFAKDSLEPPSSYQYAHLPEIDW